MTAEIWRSIPGFSGYDVSDQGRVRSWRNRWRRLAVPKLKVANSRTPYLTMGLMQDGRQVNLRVHELVALAFLGPRPAGLETRHLDGNRLNNCADNLAYGTVSENQLDAVRHGTHNNARKTHCKRGHEFTPENTYVIPRGERCCRTCRSIRARTRRDRLREVGAS